MKQYTGKTLENVLDKISEEQGVSKSEIKYEIISEKNGFLGVGKEIVIEAYTKKDIEKFIYDYLNTYFTNMNMDVEIEIINEERNFYRVVLNSEKNAILIGKNGNTLQAITTVVKQAVSNQFRTRISVLCDINGYKDEKYAKLCKMADRIAKEVKATKIDVLLDPMPNDERKQIHNHLSNVEHISTVSEGEGNQRRIKICYEE